MSTNSPFAFRHFFRTLKDPRVQGRTTHRLLDIVFMALCAVIADCNDWQEIALFVREHRAWFEQFLDLQHGVPSHDTFERVFQALDPQAFQGCFLAWIRALPTALGLKHIAIDGKRLHHAGPKDRSLGPLQLVSAWACEAHLTLGQVAVDPHSNEIAALPRLLELLDLHGALITIDAAGCQKNIAAQIVNGKGNYVLMAKGNQERLESDIQEAITHGLDNDFADMEHSCWEVEERGHGRRERRSYTVLYDLDKIRDRDLWSGLKAFGMCVSEREVAGVCSTEVRYFIGSFRGSAKEYGAAVRGHWGIENTLHWSLDMSFGEDANRVRERNGATNLGLLRRVALSLLKQQTSKLSLKCQRKQAAMNPAMLENILCPSGKSENL